MKDIFLHAGAFLLPSRFDPWPLALVEAAAAGLPVICTNVCGSSVEVIRSGYHGLVIPANHVQSLCQAMIEIHNAYPELPEWGHRGQQLAKPYSASEWAKRWAKLLIKNLEGNIA